jgi:hypothetical protein
LHYFVANFLEKNAFFSKILLQKRVARSNFSLNRSLDAMNLSWEESGVGVGEGRGQNAEGKGKRK